MTKPPASPSARFLTAKTFRVEPDVKVDYLLFLPAEYRSKPNQNWPLILFLHGAGERGTNIWKVATHGPSKYIEQHPEFPFIVVAPLCPPNEHWSNDNLVRLLDAVINEY